MEARSHEAIQRDPDYQELVRRRSSLGWTLSLIMLVIYFGFILLVAYAPKFLGTPLGTGVMTVGIPIGLAVIVSAFVLTGIYVTPRELRIRRIDPSDRRGGQVMIAQNSATKICSNALIAVATGAAPARSPPSSWRRVRSKAARSRRPTGRPSRCSSPS